MNVFVINLESASERKSRISENLKNCKFSNINFFNAVSPEEAKKYSELFNKDFKYKRGTLACALSHVLLMKKIKTLDLHGPILIIEDDVFIKKSLMSASFLFKNFLDDYDPSWDLIYLSWDLGSNTGKLWDGQPPLDLKGFKGSKDYKYDWGKLGWLTNFYLLRKIQSPPRVVEFDVWSKDYIDWKVKDILRYSYFQLLINQSAYLVNSSRIDNILSNVLPINQAIDVQILDKYDKINIYMASPALELCSPDPLTSSESFRLDYDYNKDMRILWPRNRDFINKNEKYSCKVQMHKSLIHNESIVFIKEKFCIILNGTRLFLELNIIDSAEDYYEIEFILESDLLKTLKNKNMLSIFFETFWEKKLLSSSVEFTVV